MDLDHTPRDGIRLTIASYRLADVDARATYTLTRNGETRTSAALVITADMIPRR
ncbi:hypothetical protein [Embleya sp. MST-111070]|uniref:hypothetical protein n=1 Tax=Embleya sp. MST-111070 TaxID=3398231 RepID=UPI003F738F1F